MFPELEPSADEQTSVAIGEVMRVGRHRVAFVVDESFTGVPEVRGFEERLADQLTLGPNMYGEPFLPRPSILPQFDRTVTHGGNNTFHEALYFVLPIIGCRCSGRQHDNAQQREGAGLGARLATDAWNEDELLGAAEQLENDTGVRLRMQTMSAAIQADPERVRGADLIERLVLACALVRG